MQMLGDLFQHYRQASGIAKVFHQILAAGLQVHQTGQLAGKTIEVVDRQLHAQPSGNGDQMDHRIRAAANRRQGFDCVFKSFACQHLGDGLVGMYHLDDAAASVASEHVAAAVHRRVGGIARQSDS